MKAVEGNTSGVVRVLLFSLSLNPISALPINSRLLVHSPAPCLTPRPGISEVQAFPCLGSDRNLVLSLFVALESSAFSFLCRPLVFPTENKRQADFFFSASSLPSRVRFFRSLFFSPAD